MTKQQEQQPEKVLIGMNLSNAMLHAIVNMDITFRQFQSVPVDSPIPSIYVDDRLTVIYNKDMEVVDAYYG